MADGLLGLLGELGPDGDVFAHLTVVVPLDGSDEGVFHGFHGRGGDEQGGFAHFHLGHSHGLPLELAVDHLLVVVSDRPLMFH